MLCSCQLHEGSQDRCSKAVIMFNADKEQYRPVIDCLKPHVKSLSFLLSL